MTPGLEHLGVLRLLDSTGLSHWLLGLGCFIVTTLIGFIMLIVVQFPDPDMYANTMAFSAVLSFFLVLYFAMGRGWHQDCLKFLAFDSELRPAFEILKPTGRVVLIEILVAIVCVAVNVRLFGDAALDHSVVFKYSVFAFYLLQWTLVVFCIDIVFRQIVCLMRVSKRIRIDLFSAEFYSNLANVMVRAVGLYIFGVCIISISNIVFYDGEISASELMVATMPWYLPGAIIISLYLFPYNRFRRRMQSRKAQELNCVAAALDGNSEALASSMLKDESTLSKIDLLYYQDRIKGIKEWPFTDSIRALVLFGILPPLTWVIAAFIEIVIEGAL